MKFKKYIDKNIPDLSDKLIVVTGANSGLGFELTKQIAYKHGKVLMACRNLEKANAAKEKILKEIPDASLDVIKYDQADFSSIEEFAKKIEDLKIDSFVFNAGIYHPRKYLKTVDGFPLTIGTNYVGAYYLTRLLDKSFKNGNIKRAIFVSSVVHVIGHYKDPKTFVFGDDKNVNRTYNVSKQMCYELAGNIKDKYKDELEVVLTHPGIAKTGILREEHNSFSYLFKKLGDTAMRTLANSAEKSALCTLIAVSKEKVEELDYYFPRGLFHIAGKPGHKKLKINKTKNESLELVSQELFSN